jgi:hypothetical protein
MDSTNIPDKFFEKAEEWILDYLTQFRDKWENNVEECKEDMLEEGFSDVEFTSIADCLALIETPYDMFVVTSFVANQDKEMGVESKTEMVDIFNRCWYYTGRMLIYDEWDNMIDQVTQNHPGSIFQEIHV